MICKNCSAEFDDSAAQCPECGMENEAVTESFEEKNESAEASDEIVEEEKAAQQGESEASSDEEAREAPARAVASENSQENDRQEKSDEEKSVEKKPTGVKRVERPVARRTAPGRNIKRRPIRVTKREKRISAFIIVLMCLVGVCAGVTAYLNITTDIFRVDTSADKIVAGVALVPQEEKQLEELLAKCFSVAKNEFGSESTCVESLLAKINPADKGNIYSRINNTAEELQTTADPADRFADENGEYAYYKLSEKKVDAVLECFGLESHRGENGESYYYCDGYYYFASRPAETQTVKAEVTKTRRILDGSYYAEFYFYAENDGKIKKSKTRYLIMEMNKDETSGDISFEIKKTSSKAVTSADGKLIDSAKTYDRKTEVIEGHTKDGILFCRYVIEYPVLVGDEAGYQNVNDMFKNTVSVYEMKAQSVDAAYKQFKTAGGEEDQLPYIENVVASVIFEDGKNISFAEKIYKLDPDISEETQQDSYYYTEEQVPEARLYETSIESYTVDKQSGNFVSKDSVIGKDYMLVSEVLYRIYNGYEYDSVLPSKENTEDDTGYYYDEIPEDTAQVGASIYESAWALTKSGVTFWYKTEQGYLTEVTVPYKVAKKLAK